MVCALTCRAAPCPASLRPTPSASDWTDVDRATAKNDYYARYGDSRGPMSLKFIASQFLGFRPDRVCPAPRRPATERGRQRACAPPCM
jgi:hypothetical protein